MKISEVFGIWVNLTTSQVKVTCELLMNDRHLEKARRVPTRSKDFGDLQNRTGSSIIMYTMTNF